MSQVTETQTISVVKGDDFKVINKNVIILRRFMRNKLAVFGLGLFPFEQASFSFYGLDVGDVL